MPIRKKFTSYTQLSMNMKISSKCYAKTECDLIYLFTELSATHTYTNYSTNQFRHNSQIPCLLIFFNLFIVIKKNNIYYNTNSIS